MTPFRRRLSHPPSHSTVPSCWWWCMMMMMIIMGCSVWHVGVSADDSTNTNCAMDIWIFSSFESCQASDAPVANGKIYADGQCRTIETDLDPSDPSYASFPGNYRVQCIDSQKIRFTDSACLDGTCSVTTLVQGGTAVCDRDNASPASLYSRLEPPEYAVQDPANANVGAFYTCLKLGSADVLTVTFVVFGDCSQCVVATAPTTTTTVAPIPVLPSTAPPVSVAPATPPPVASFTTFAPATPPVASVAPTTTTTGNVTTNSTTTAVPSMTPSTFPIATTVAPVVVVVTATPAPVVATAPIDTGLVHDVISVAIQLSPMNTTIDTTSAGSIWEDVTMDQIRSVAESDVYNTIIYAIDISNITQNVMDLTGTTSTVTRRWRSLQEDNVTTISIGTTKSMALQIMFDVSMSYTLSSATTTATTLADLFTASFDSEQDRSNYLIKLVTNDDIFTSVRLVEVLYVNGTNTTGPDQDNPQTLPGPPVAAPTTEAIAQSEETSNTTLLVALAGGGTALIVFAIFGIVFYQRQHNKHNSGNSKGQGTNEVETPSDNDEYYGGGPVGPLNFSNNHPPNSPASQQQRWTNEIVVDPSADDVSTLGGSVLLGYLDPTTANPNNNNNNNTSHTTVEDEPTASVNLDFDYNNNQYRSDLEDRSRTVFTETTGPTAFTNFTSKLGMNGDGMFSDDASFDELYAEIDDAANDTTNDKIVREQQSQHLNKIASMVQPFEVRVPPGKLGMVVDTPNGGVPVVRAIRPDSILHDKVLVGDRLISVDHKDVTNLTALQVSSLISLKKDQERLMVFCRLQPTATTPQSSTAFVAPSSPVGTPP